MALVISPLCSRHALHLQVFAKSNQFAMQQDRRSPVHTSSPGRSLPGTVILYQSYLFKTPPLDKLFVVSLLTFI